MSQLSLFKKDKVVNINQIKVKPMLEAEKFSDYKINIEDAVEEPPVKKWIEQHVGHKELRNKIINNPNNPHIRLKHDGKGNVREVYLQDYGGGYLCCMNYRDRSSWPRLINLIEKFGGYND